MKKTIVLLGLLLLGGFIVTSVHAVEVTGATPGYIVITNNHTNLTFRVPVAILSERNLNSSFYEKAKSLTKSSKPLLTLSYPFNNTKNYNNSVPIVGQALSVNQINSIKYSLDNGSWISIHLERKGDIYEFNTTIFAVKGSHTLIIKAVDSKNHVSSLEVNFEVAITKGRWAFYKVPWPIYRGGTFYTQTGYKIVIKNDWSYSDYLSGKLPSIYVYSPDGKLYAQLKESVIKAVPGKLVWNYNAVKSISSNADWCFWTYQWLMTPNNVGHTDPGSGRLQLNNVKIYLYETQNAGANWKQTYKVDNFNAQYGQPDYIHGDLFTAVRLYNGPNLAVSDGYCGFLNIKNPYLPGDYASPEILGAGYHVYTKTTKYVSYYNVYTTPVTYTYYPPIKSNIKLIKFNYISNKTGLNILVHDDDANPITYKQFTSNDGIFDLNINELKRYLYNATLNLKVDINGKPTTPIDDYFVLSDYPDEWETYTISKITAPNKVYSINPSTAGLIPNQVNTVVVKATDAAGRVTTKNINVYYDNKPPAIAVSPYKKTKTPILVYDNGNYGISPWGKRITGWPDSTAGWIWTQKSTSVVPPGSVTLMKSFTVSKSGTFTFYTTADNSFTLSVDSKNILSGNNWQKAYKTTYNLSAGTHTIKIIATNAGTSPNPAGVLFAMYSSTGKLILQSDRTWNHGFIVATLFNGQVTLDVSDISGVRAINVTTVPYGTIIYGDTSYTLSKSNPWAAILTHKITDTNLSQTIQEKLEIMVPDKTVTVSIKAEDGVFNTIKKNYTFTYSVPIVQLTSEENNGRYTPLKNTGEFTATTYGEPAISVSLKLNNSDWVLMKHVTTNNWILNDPSILFKPNAWNTVTLHAVGENNKSTTETTKFYYGESISWNFNTPSNRTGWFNYHLASTKNNIYLEGHSSAWATSNINKGIVVKIGTKTNNIGMTGGKWKLYSLNLTRGVYNIKFYEKVGYPGNIYGWVTVLKEFGEVKLGVSNPSVLQFTGKTWYSISKPDYWSWYTAYGASDNVSVN